MAASLFLPSFFIFGPMAILTRLVTKEKVSLIWLVESVIMLLLFLGFEYWI